MSNQLLKGLPGEPALQGDLVVTDTDSVTPIFKVALDGTLSAGKALALPLETGLTAHAGGGQALALALSAVAVVHNVTTVASAADSVALPLATGSGKVHLVRNSAALNSMQVFGSGTDTIDGVATGTGVAVAAGKALLVVDIAAGAWVGLAGA